MTRSVVLAALAVVMVAGACKAQEFGTFDAFSHGPNSIESFTIQRPMVLTFSNGNKNVFTIKPDGSIELGEGFAADDAARAMWKLMEYHLHAIAACQEPK